MCDEAWRISRGPLRVPRTYDVVRSTGTGRMTTLRSSNERGVRQRAAEGERRAVIVLERKTHAAGLETRLWEGPAVDGHRPDPTDRSAIGFRAASVSRALLASALTSSGSAIVASA